MANYRKSNYGKKGNRGKKKNYKSRNKHSGISKYSASERRSYRNGFLAGLFAFKKKKAPKRKSNAKKESLLEKIKRYRKHNLGVLYHNGRYYDTNFIDKPHEISKNFVKELHSEYDFDGKRSDIEVADAYVRHMRRKCGTFSRETGEFLGMLGE